MLLEIVRFFCGCCIGWNLRPYPLSATLLSSGKRLCIAILNHPCIGECTARFLVEVIHCSWSIIPRFIPVSLPINAVDFEDHRRLIHFVLETLYEACVLGIFLLDIDAEVCRDDVWSFVNIYFFRRCLWSCVFLHLGFCRMRRCHWCNQFCATLCFPVSSCQLSMPDRLDANQFDNDLSFLPSVTILSLDRYFLYCFVYHIGPDLRFFIVVIYFIPVFMNGRSCLALQYNSPENSCSP